VDAEVLEAIREAYETRGIAEGLAAMLPLVHPDVEIVGAGAFPGTETTFRGPDGIRTFYAQLDEAFEEFRYDVEQLVPYGDEVLVVEFVARGRGRTSGLDVRQPAAHVILVEDGLVARAEAHIDRDAAHASAAALSSD
jgi:ketosteroid isomerase-like protein